MDTRVLRHEVIELWRGLCRARRSRAFDLGRRGLDSLQARSIIGQDGDDRIANKMLLVLIIIQWRDS